MPNQLRSAIREVAASLLQKLPKAFFLFFLLGWLSSYLGRWYWCFDLATHFRLQYFAGGAAMTLVFLLCKQWRWAALAFCCALANGASVLPWHFPAAQVVTARPDEQPLRLLFANVFFKNKRYEDFLALVKAEHPDLLFVQEVTPPWAQTLERLRGEYPHGVIEAATDAGGIAVLSRLPLNKAADAGLGEYNGPSLELQLDINGKPLTIVTAHTAPPMSQRRAQQRNEHLRLLAEHLRQLPAPKLLIGDLNSTMWSPYFADFVTQADLLNARAGFGVLPTWPTWQVFGNTVTVIPIDHCLVSRDIRVVNFRRVPYLGSDHLWLIVDLALPGAQH